MFVGKLLQGSAATLAWIDTNVIDGIANGIAGGFRFGGNSLRLLQSGQVQTYGVVAFAGILITGGLVFLLNPL